MPTQPLPLGLPLTAPDIARRLTIILAALAAVVARAFLRQPGRVALILPLWNRLSRAAQRFTRLAARVAAGRPAKPSRPGIRPGAHSSPAPIRFPTAHGWLVADLRHEAAVYAIQLEALLAEPATIAFLAAAPTASRILNPLRHMLGLPAGRPRTRAQSIPDAPPAPTAPPQATPCPIRQNPPCPRARWPWAAPRLTAKSA